ncbi:Rho GTPase activating protein 21 [Echinococcus multilocularis]|uniref:Rho GTPase activating protein 21 n=1 Tax=Echinococcus multilocularis TaxID=6211 RepID=A0A068XVS1_ECHMU|nr:Rho GTPase activating protein 21 [Echinococcus multilocularis]
MLSGTFRRDLMSTPLSSSPAKVRDAVTIVIPRGPIGFEFSIKSQGPRIVISKVRQGGTAELAGLKCGSILQAVNQQPINGLSFLQVSNMIRRTSGFTAEISVIEPEEAATVNIDDSFVPDPASSFRYNLDGVLLRDSPSKSSAASANSSHPRSERGNAPATRVELLQGSRSSSPLEMQQRNDAFGRVNVPPVPSDLRLQLRQDYSLTSAADGHLVSPRGLRRQALLFSKDSTYVKEPSPRSSSSAYDKKASEGTHMLHESLDNMISAFDSTLKVVHRESSAPPAPTPQLIRRQAYPSSSSVTSLSSSPLLRDRSIRTTPGASDGPRFLPAHLSFTVPHVTPPQPTFLPKLSVRRKISSPLLQTEKSSGFREPRSTNLSAYMDELTVSSAQDHGDFGNTASDKCSLLGRNEISPSPRQLPLLANTTLTLSDTDQTRRNDDLPSVKNANDLRTAETSRQSRYRLLRGFAHGEALNTEPSFYKSEQCLCKVAKIDGRALTLAIWRRFYIYIGNGFVLFILASNDCHSFKKSTPVRFCHDDSSLANVDPFTPDSVSSSRIVLPLHGLQWSNLRHLPSDLPTWGSLSSSAYRLHCSPSEMFEFEANAVDDLQCYLFEHEDNGGTQVTAIFSNRQAATSALSLCQRYGGVCKENNPPDSSGLSYSLSLHTGLAVYHPSPNGGGGSGTLRRTRKSLQDSVMRRRFAAECSHQEGKLSRGKLNEGASCGTEDPTSITTAERLVDTNDTVGVDGTSRFRFLSSAAAPFFKGIANALSNSRAAPTLTTPAPPLPPSNPEELARRIAAIIGEPPDFSDLNNPGPVFGAPLENQIPSPDYPGVPLILHTMVIALELHGLHHVGLYRAPGRQKEINRFVCLANLTSLDPNAMLHLDTWRDIRALTGVIKTFFRRLPEPIFDPVSWGPLASIVPESSVGCTKTSLAYALLAILAKLNKIRTISGPLTSLETSNRVNNIKYEKSMPSWHFATLDFLFGHLRRLVALEEANQCSFECIAICFGPSLFRGDSSLQPKFNKILEVMLQHWPWLVAGFLETTADHDNMDHNSSSHHPTLAQTETYVQHFFVNGVNFSEESYFHFRPLETAKRAAYFSNDLVEDVLTAVEDIFVRAGLSVGSISRSESFKSINRTSDEDGSLLDVIMRSLSASSDLDSQKLVASPNFEGGHNAVLEQQCSCDQLNEASSFSPHIQRVDF